jgi:hypothetical protein
VDNIMLLFSALLCEKRIIITASGLGVLSECIHAAVALLYPLNWQHVYIPLLPHNLLDYASAPMPFVMGVRSTHIDQVLAQPLQAVVVVNLDQDVVSISCGEGQSGELGPFSFPLPAHLGGKLSKHLKGNLKKNNQALCDGFLAFFVILFNQAKFDSHVSAKGTFDADRFLAAVRAKDEQVSGFLEVMRHSQMFEAHCDQKVRAALAPVESGGLDRFEQLCLQVEFDKGAFKFSAVLKKIKADGSFHASLANAGHIETSPDAVFQATMELTSNSDPKRDRAELVRWVTEATFDSRLCLHVLEALWTRIKDSKKKNWRHGHKALILLQHLMKNGSDRVTTHASHRTNFDLITTLSAHKNSEVEAVQKIPPIANRVRTLLRNVFEFRLNRKYAFVTNPARYRHGPSAVDAENADAALLREYRHRSLIEVTVPALPSFDTLHQRHGRIYARAVSPSTAAPVPQEFSNGTVVYRGKEASAPEPGPASFKSFDDIANAPRRITPTFSSMFEGFDNDGHSVTPSNQNALVPHSDFVPAPTSPKSSVDLLDFFST